MNNPMQGSNNMMDMLKTQLMTMTMVSSMHGSSSNNHNNGNNNNGVLNMIYVFIATGVIDFLCKTILPTLQVEITKYYKEKLQSNQLVKEIMKTTESPKVKTSSITVLVNIADHENMFGQALLDYITNNEHTKHISFKKQNFVLNQSDIIEIYEDFFVKLNENKMIDNTEKPGNSGIEQTIELFSFIKTMQELRGFLNKITHEYKIKIENKLGDKMYYFNQHPMNAAIGVDGQKDYSKLPNNSIFTMKVFQTNRRFSNLFGPEINIVRKRVDFFIKNRKWYDAKGIPYTLGLLLSGQAGSGKTSSIKCLANETKRHIININLNNDITKTQLENLFFNELIMVLNVSTGQSEKYYIPLDQRIYVLEDIDCQSDLVMERGAKENTSSKTEPIVPTSIKTNPNKPDTYANDEQFTQAQKIDLSFLLNLLDGVLEIPGRIVIMTSNFPEKLDHALVRPGRIDVIANFKKCTHTTIIEMMEFFYDIHLTDKEKSMILHTPEYCISPAEMSKIMFENFGDHVSAISKIEGFNNIIANITSKNETTFDPEFKENKSDGVNRLITDCIDGKLQYTLLLSDLDKDLYSNPQIKFRKNVGDTTTNMSGYNTLVDRENSGERSLKEVDESRESNEFIHIESPTNVSNPKNPCVEGELDIKNNNSFINIHSRGMKAHQFMTGDTKMVDNIQGYSSTVLSYNDIVKNDNISTPKWSLPCIVPVPRVGP